MLFASAWVMGRPLTVVALWMCVIVLALLIGLAPAEPFATALQAINLEFAFGILAAMFYLSGRRLSWWVIVPGLVVPIALWISFGRPAR
jgi:hypothetical protein